MNYIYTITAIEESGLYSRCFGFFFNETDARVAAFNNQCDLRENLYQYLIIEKHPPGIRALALNVVQWYTWSSLTEYWEECEEPKGRNLNGVINWNGIG